MGGIGPELDGPGARFFDAIINGELENSNPFKKSEFRVDIKEFSRSDEIPSIMGGLFTTVTNRIWTKYQP